MCRKRRAVCGAQLSREVASPGRVGEGKQCGRTTVALVYTYPLLLALLCTSRAGNDQAADWC